MSYRDVKDLPAERGFDVSTEAVRLWELKFGQAYAYRIRKRRDPAFEVWHLDKVFAKIGGTQMSLRRVVDGTVSLMRTDLQSTKRCDA